MMTISAYLKLEARGPRKDKMALSQTQGASIIIISLPPCRVQERIKNG